MTISHSDQAPLVHVTPLTTFSHKLFDILIQSVNTELLFKPTSYQMAAADVQQPVQAEPAPSIPDYLADPDAVLKDNESKWRYGRAPDYSKTRKVYSESKYSPSSLFLVNTLRHVSPTCQQQGPRVSGSLEIPVRIPGTVSSEDNPTRFGNGRPCNELKP